MPDAVATAEPPIREALLERGRRLELLTVGWNVIEAVVAIAAGVVAGSVSLTGFGIDSVVESSSGLVLLWRLARERNAAAGGRPLDHEELERIERRAERLVGGSLFALAAFIAVEAVLRLLEGARPETSPVGIVLTSLSLVVMWWLFREKRRVSVGLGSRAMHADSVQTEACFRMSAIVLAGIVVNALLGWWWADSIAGLALALLIGQEALEAWRGEDECEDECAAEGGTDGGDGVG